MPFYVPDNYSPEAIALAEGLKELGHEVFANIDYWFIPEEDTFLLHKNETGDYNIAVYDYKYLYHSIPWTFNRIDKTRINILLDRNDWLTPRWNDPKVLNSFNYILIDHMLKGFKYPKHVLPWSIGLTNRVIKYIDENLSAGRPESSILWNFRVGHNLRKLLTTALNHNLGKRFPVDNSITSNIDENLDEDELKVHKSYWEQSARRHNPKFYQDLNNHLLTYAYGGYYEFKPFLYQPYSFQDKVLRKINYFGFNFKRKTGLDFSKQVFVFQYDSFRFWETLYSLSCPIHLDFDSWGFVLPVNPVEGQHYLGIKKFNFHEFSSRIQEFSNEEINAIGLEGRKWVFENYSPKAVAERLLQIIN